MNIFHLFMNTALLVIKYSPGTCREPRVDDAGSEGADRNSPLKSTHSGWGEIGGQWKCKKDYFLVSDKCEKEWSKEMGQASLRGGGFRRLIGVQPRWWWLSGSLVIADTIDTYLITEQEPKMVTCVRSLLFFRFKADAFEASAQMVKKYKWKFQANQITELLMWLIHLFPHLWPCVN